MDEISEGALIPLDVTAYSSVVVVPKKVGQGFVITKETIEDSLIPVQRDQLNRHTLRVANKIDKDRSSETSDFPECISALDAGRSGSTTATGKSLALDGTEFVMSGSGGCGLGTYDIIKGKALVENNNYVPDSMVCHPLSKQYIERLPGFTAEFAYGAPIMQEGFIAKAGAFGKILGLEAFASTNCATGSAYVICRGATPNIMGQYKEHTSVLAVSPLGMFVETSGADKKNEINEETDLCIEETMSVLEST